VEVGGLHRVWGCSVGSGLVFRCSRGAVCGSEWGRAGDSAVVEKHVDSDVAVALRVLGCSTRVKGASWGQRGGVGGSMDRCWRWWGW
jgi:hypothetical protein